MNLFDVDFINQWFIYFSFISIWAHEGIIFIDIFGSLSFLLMHIVEVGFEIVL